MPRLSFWKNKRGLNYKYVDGIMRQIFTIGGTGVYIHKYLGPNTIGDSGPEHPHWKGPSLKSKNDATQVPEFSTENKINELNIQDLFYLENRDRKYDKNIYELRAHYNVSDTNFDLRQFGLFLTSDEITMTFHYNDMISRIGREIISGDVVEVLHLQDQILDPDKPLINKFFVVQDAFKAAEGYDPFWWHHMWKIRATAINNQQEFYDILQKEFVDINEERKEKTIEEIYSKIDIDLEISDAIDREAHKNVPLRKFYHSHLYILPKLDHNGKPIETKLTDETICLAYGDGIPPNGAILIGKGFYFPEDAKIGDFFLRIDYNPYVLFEKTEKGWRRREIDWRTRWSPANDVLRRFINNDEEIEYQNTKKKISKKQYISKVLAPDIE